MQNKKILISIIVALLLGATFVAFKLLGSSSNDYARYDEDFSEPSLQNSDTFSNIQPAESIQPSGISLKRSYKKLSFSESTSPSPSVSNSSIKKPAEKPSRLIIRTGQLSMVAKEVKETVEKVSNLVIDAGGFIVESEIKDSFESQYGAGPTAFMKVRVPAEGFDSFISAVRTLAARVKDESFSGQDVTEDYVDIQSQLRTLRISEEQYVKLMARANTIEDILKVRAELDAVQKEIERMEGKKKYFEESAALSTLSLYISAEEENLPTFTPGEKWRPQLVYKSAIRTLIETGRGVANFGIRMGVLAPVWIPILVILFVLGRSVRRKWNDWKTNHPASAPPPHQKIASVNVTPNHLARPLWFIVVFLGIQAVALLIAFTVIILETVF